MKNYFYDLQACAIFMILLPIAVALGYSVKKLRTEVRIIMDLGS